MNNDLELIKKIQERVDKEHPGCRIIYAAYYGSHLFGLNSATSDTDYFGLFIPSLEDILLQKEKEYLNFDSNPEEKNTADDDDIKFFSIYKFFTLLKRGDHGMFDLLFSMLSDKVILETPESNVIKNNYKDFVIKKPEAFVGFANKQANKYSVKGDRLKLLEDIILELQTDSKLNKKQKLELIFDSLKEKFKDSKYVEFESKEEGEYISILNRQFVSTSSYHFLMTSLYNIKKTYGDRAEKAKDSNGLDFKAFSHAIRALIEAKELISTGFITLPLKPADAAFVKDIKYGKYKDIAYLSNIMEEGMDDLILLKEESTLPETIKDSSIQKSLKLIFKESYLSKELTIPYEKTFS